MPPDDEKHGLPVCKTCGSRPMAPPARYARISPTGAWRLVRRRDGGRYVLEWRCSACCAKVRRYPRVEAHIPFTFTVYASKAVPSAASARHQATTEDASASGLRFLSPLPVAPGDVLEITIALPAKQAMTFFSRIVWAVRTTDGRAEVGVDFHGASGPERGQAQHTAA